MYWSCGADPSIYLEVDPVPLHGVESWEREGGLMVDGMKISIEICPWCRHSAHRKDGCKEKDTFAGKGLKCFCSLSWPMTEVEALRYLEKQSQIRKGFVEMLEKAQSDVVNAKTRLHSAQAEEDGALHILTMVRYLESGGVCSNCGGAGGEHPNVCVTCGGTGEAKKP